MVANLIARLLKLVEVTEGKGLHILSLNDVVFRSLIFKLLLVSANFCGNCSCFLCVLSRFLSVLFSARSLFASITRLLHLLLPHLGVSLYGRRAKRRHFTDFFTLSFIAILVRKSAFVPMMSTSLITSTGDGCYSDICLILAARIYAHSIRSLFLS